MKKRAIVSTLASLALAGVMCVGFAACGGSDPEAKSIVGEEVTEEQWNAAFNYTSDDFKNFKIEIEEGLTEKASMGKQSSETEATRTQTVSFVNGKTYGKIVAETSISLKGDFSDAEKEYIKQQEKEGTYTVEYYVDSETSQTIAMVDGSYKAVDDTYKYYHFCESGDAIGVSIVSNTNFADYVYSADQKGYVKKNAEEGETYVIKFQDGKLKALYIEASEEGTEGGATMSYTEYTSYVITYGGQSVNVPTVA